MSLKLTRVALGIPYEIAALNVLLTYWTDKVPVAAVVVICIVLYAYVIPSQASLTAIDYCAVS